MAIVLEHDDGARRRRRGGIGENGVDGRVAEFLQET